MASGKRVVVLHDDNTIVPLVAGCFEDSVQRKILDPESHIDDASLVVIVADLRVPVPILEWQKACLSSLTGLLVIGLEPAFLWLGPYVCNERSGCFRCLRAWVQNNYRDTTHWSDPDNVPAETTRQLTAPLPPVLRAVLSEYLHNIIAEADPAVMRLHNTVIRFDLRRALTSKHTFIANPLCADCSSVPPDDSSRSVLAMTERRKTDVNTYRSPNAKLSTEALKEKFVDRHTGLVKHVFNGITSDLMPMYTAELPIMHTDEIESGYGRQETRQGSEMVSILETLERYAGHMPRGARSSVRASYSEVRDRAVDPRSLILHGAEQHTEPGFRLDKYTDQLEFNWVWGYSLISHKPILVPEQSVYYYLFDTPAQPVNRFVYETSNGCALGGSPEEAVLYGLLELIERDAYLTTWYGRMTPVAIDLHGITDERVQLLLLRCEAQGLQLHAFDIRQGINLPIIWCMVVDPAADAVVKSYCAAGAHFMPQDAIYSALTEVTTSIGVYRKSMLPLKERALTMLDDRSKVQAMHDHVLLYSLPETFSRLDFLFDDRPPSDVATLYKNYERPQTTNLTDDLRWLIKQVKGIAEDIIVIDQGFPDLADNGLHSFKVIAPGLMPVSFGHQYRRVSLDRVNSAAKASGLPGFTDLGQLNPFPHNFP